MIKGAQYLAGRLKEGVVSGGRSLADKMDALSLGFTIAPAQFRSPLLTSIDICMLPENTRWARRLAKARVISGH